MRWLIVVVLAACSNTTSRSGHDAGPDAKQFLDARIDAAAPLDAYAPRPCDAPAHFAEAHVPSRVLYVVAGAIQGDGSMQRPFGSIAAAAAAATPGTWIQLLPATNGARHATDQFIANLQGLPTAPIWIGGAFGTQPQLLGGSEGIHLTNSRYVVIQNLEIGNVTAHALNIDDGVTYSGNAGPIAIVNVHVHDADSSLESTCIKASGAFYLHVSDSRIRRCGIGLDAVGTRSSLIARNRFEDTVTNAVRIRGGSQDVDVRQNYVWNGGETAISLGGFTPLDQFRPPLSMTTPNAEARALRAFNNAVTGDMTAAFAFDNCIDCLIAHNFVYGGEQRILRLLQNSSSRSGYTFAPTSNGRVINNSFSWSSLELLSQIEIGAGVDPSTFTFSHNLWNCIDQPSSSQPTLPTQEIAGVYGIGTGYFPTVPLPGYCSGPEAGRAVTFPEVEGTIEGFCRSTGDALTIGPQMLQTTACVPI